MGQPNTVNFEELGTEPKEKNYAGPFYRKDSDGKYHLTHFCAECAFGDEVACLLNPCILLSSISDEEEN